MFGGECGERNLNVCASMVPVVLRLSKNLVISLKCSSGILFSGCFSYNFLSSSCRFASCMYLFVGQMTIAPPLSAGLMVLPCRLLSCCRATFSFVDRFGVRGMVVEGKFVWSSCKTVEMYWSKVLLLGMGGSIWSWSKRGVVWTLCS